MTNKLTGNGRPSMHLKGEVGQYYEDMLTGDLYECRVASEFSKTNGRPFGGYVWEMRAKGEDVREIYGGQDSSQNVDWKDVTNKPFYEETKTMSILENYEFAAGTPSMGEVDTTLVAGDVVEVIYNGNSYVCNPYWSNGAYCIGNENLVGGDSVTGEPFFICNVDSARLGVFCAESATVSVYITREVVKQLDSKFVPGCLILRVIENEDEFIWDNPMDFSIIWDSALKGTLTAHRIREDGSIIIMPLLSMYPNRSLIKFAGSYYDIGTICCDFTPSGMEYYAN